IADADQTEISYELYLQRTAADLVVSQIASPGAVVAGSTVIYQIDLINRGLPPARNIVVKDILPAAATLVSCSVSSGGTCNANANEVAVDVPVMRGGATASLTLVAATSCAMPDGTALTNAASATTTVRERTTENNSAAATVTVINLTPVIGPMTATPPVLWPPKGKLIDVAVNYEVNGSCGPIQCALDVASNPPLTEEGDEDDDDDDDDEDCRKRDQHDDSHHCEHHKTKPNWIIIDAHHV